MEEQLDDNLSIYCETANDDIIVSSGDEWDNDSDHSEKDSSAINQLIIIVVSSNHPFP